MTKEEHAKVLAALEAITKHFSISRLHESTLADTTVRGQAHEAIAIMRKEPEPIGDAEMAARLRSAWQNHTGHEPSESVLASAIDDAAALLEKAR